MLLLIGSFIAGILTVFAPCIFALLPVIIGGSMTGGIPDKRRPVIIAVSLSLSLLLFTILLKALSLFANIPPQTFTYISGGILITLGALLLFPEVYEKIIAFFNFQSKSQRLLGKSSGHSPTVSAVITGAALGPVFSSCSPVYVYIIATILPVNFTEAMIYMLAYIAGLGFMVLLIGYLGQRLVKKLKFAANPKGWFQRTIAVLFIVVGIMVATGTDKTFQTYISNNTAFDFDALSAKLLPKGKNSDAGKEALNVNYSAPEFTGLEHWINSEPLMLSELRGKVVLVDFWTYSCINCIRTQPYLKDWHNRYRDSGFEIIGVHAPEFSFEKIPKNVEAAAKKAGLEYPIALDNDFATWAAYENQFWPATYLIDVDGNVRRYHAGEGEYDKTEQAIRALLTEAGKSLPEASSGLGSRVPVTAGQTPETYLGARRASNYVGAPTLINNGSKEIFTPAELKTVNQWTLSGGWEVSNEGIVAENNAELKIRVAAKDIYLVTGSDIAARDITVTLNGEPISNTDAAGSDINNSRVTVSKATLYRIASFPSFRKDSMVMLKVPPGVQLNVFTFGGR